jgi:triacylglycerol lipase
MVIPSLLLAAGLAAQTPAPARNAHPLVLVGGFTVWGREEGLGFRYWGGTRDIQEDLKAQGHTVVTAAPSPFASNWDRACEVFAMLRGGPVDYGQAHAAAHGHARMGRTYPALVPGWGSSALKVHLVGHSMGGQTARLLAQLLGQGDEAERKATPAGSLSPLFQGGHAWVASVTTLATPHEGTTLTWKREGLVGPAQKLFALGASLHKPGHEPVYDAKLDQWGLTRQKGESSRAFLRRVSASPLWNGTRDFSVHELSPEGAREFNGWVRAQPEVYYFSWSTEKTRPDTKGHQVPSLRMTPLWYLGSRFMGRTIAVPNHEALDGTWFRNDGVVNTRSMAGPRCDEIHSFDGTARRGQWNHMGVLSGWDHSEIIGIGPEHGEEVLPFYRRWAAFLAGLQD